MADIENYEKFRGELSIMFLEGANLMEENDFRSLKNCKDMKEEGNSFFRLGKVDDDLEIYGYAETLLVKSKFEEEVDKIEMWNLSLCILQKISACLSSLKEFEQVGQIVLPS
ncbi:DNA-directed RNA polymerase subunit B' [Bienertia sinuspersici]